MKFYRQGPLLLRWIFWQSVCKRFYFAIWAMTSDYRFLIGEISKASNWELRYWDHKSKFIDIDIKQHFCNTHVACKLKYLESYWVIKWTNWILIFFSSCDENIYFIYFKLAPIAFQLLFISWIFWYLPK